MARPKKKESKKETKRESKRTEPVDELMDHLYIVLSDLYVLAVKAHGYHWNVTGPNFAPLHEFFSKEYLVLFETADLIAERIRALGGKPDGRMETFLQNSNLSEARSRSLSAEDMLQDLFDSNMAMREHMTEVEDMADDMDDVVTQDMLTQIMGERDKAMWMIRAHLE